MKLFELVKILESYPLTKQEFLKAGIPDADIDKYFNEYKDLIKRNRVSGPERDINHWKKLGWDAFKDFVDTTAETKGVTKTQMKRHKAPGKAITLFENTEWLIVIPLDHDSSCYHGKDTDWCTTKPNQPYFKQYFYDREITLIYLLHKKDGSRFAIAYNVNYPRRFELFDKEDSPVSADKFRELTGFSVETLIEKAQKIQDTEIGPGREESRGNDLESLLHKAIYVTGERDPKLEALIIAKKNVYAAEEYLEAVVDGRWPAAEPLLLKTPEQAVKYAKKYNTGRLKKWEPAILAASGVNIAKSDDPAIGIYYARDTIKGRWPELESQIVAEPDLSTEYAKEVIKGRWPEAEPYVLEVPMFSYVYARDVIKGRWPEAEAIISEERRPYERYLEFLKKKGIEI